jgi:predicted DNA-binding transcriptional regulator YafY
MEKWDKIVTLHRLLLSRKYPVPLPDILDDLECSRATFHRLRRFMVDRLEAPLVRDKKYGGYTYAHQEGKRYELPGVWFTTDELEALSCFEHLLISLHANILGPVIAPARAQLDKFLKAQLISRKNWLNRIKIIPIASRSTDAAILHCIADGVLHAKKVTITYRSLTSEEKSTRTISPQTLLRYRDNWYVDAWCHLREDLRTFSVNRILDATLHKEKSKQLTAEALEQHFSDAYGIFSGKAEHVAEILFTGYAAKIVSQEQWHPRQQGSVGADGSFLMKIPFHETRELVMDIMRWGDMAHVVEPQLLRDKVKECLEKTLHTYK